VERAPSQGLVAVMRVGQRGQHRRRGRRGVEELAAAGQLGLAGAVAEQSIVADALEAVGQDVQQEASSRPPKCGVRRRVPAASSFPQSGAFMRIRMTTSPSGIRS